MHKVELDYIEISTAPPLHCKIRLFLILSARRNKQIWCLIMSFVIDTCVWLSDSNHIDSIARFGQLLKCIPILKHQTDDGDEIKRFSRLRVYTGQSSNVILDEVLNTNEVSLVQEKLMPYAEANIGYEIDSSFDYFSYSKDTNQVEPTVGPLRIKYYGSQYEWQGHYFKRFGPLRLSFFNNKVFRVPEVLVYQIQKAASEGTNCTTALQMIAKLSHNFDLIKNLTKELIRNLDPLHIMTCTEGEIHPLKAHAIYHRNWEDYFDDLIKIAKLHKYGGNYFCEVNPGEPAFNEPRNPFLDYGYIRRWSDDQEDFTEELQLLVNTVLKKLERVQSASKLQIDECFRDLEDTTVEEINNSYFISMDNPFEYIEEPYFRLFKAIYKAEDMDADNYKM
jgi:hypothetical protein